MVVRARGAAQLALCSLAELLSPIWRAGCCPLWDAAAPPAYLLPCTAQGVAEGQVTTEAAAAARATAATSAAAAAAAAT